MPCRHVCVFDFVSFWCLQPFSRTTVNNNQSTVVWSLAFFGHSTKNLTIVVPKLGVCNLRQLGPGRLAGWLCWRTQLTNDPPSCYWIGTTKSRLQRISCFLFPPAWCFSSSWWMFKKVKTLQSDSAPRRVCLMAVIKVKEALVPRCKWHSSADFKGCRPSIGTPATCACLWT